jgi:type I restriction-modification system DNA methylase subunit
MNFWEDLNKTDHLTKEEAQKQGSFFTPKELALNMAQRLEWKPGQKVVDPCVGKGALLQACKEVYSQITEDLFYGIDIDSEAIKFCKEHFPGGHFQVGNCLVDDFTNDVFWQKDSFESFDDYKKRIGYKEKFKFGVIK